MKDSINHYINELAGRQFQDDIDSCLALLEAMTSIMATGKPLNFEQKDSIRRQTYIHWMNQLTMGLNHHFSSSIGNLSEMMESLQTEIRLCREELNTNQHTLAELHEEAEVLERINNFIVLKKDLQKTLEPNVPWYETLKTCGSRLSEQKTEFEQLFHVVGAGLLQMKHLLQEELSQHEKLLQDVENKLSNSGK